METVNKSKVDSILERLREGLKRGEVPVELYGDKEVYEAELDRIMGSSWLILGLEAEIPNKGDYMLRYMGQDEVIVTRDETGQIRVMLNHCRHRGTAVCRDMKGNSSHFVCGYHGWTFKNTGKWIAAPHKNVSYKHLDGDKWGLLQARVEVRWGLIFANIDPNAPSLDDDLGDASFLFDLFLGLDSRGLRVLGEPSNYVMKKNWKMGLENAVGDCFHIFFGHTSMVDVQMLPPVHKLSDNYTTWHTASNGTGIMCKELDSVPNFKPEGTKFNGYTPEILDLFDKNGIDERHWKFLNDYHPFIIGHFPNAYIFRWYSPDPVTGNIATFYQLRIMQPRGVDETEVCNIMFNYAIEPEENAELAYQGALLMMGAGGFLDMDDGANWEGSAVAGKTLFAKKHQMNLNYQMGLDGIGTDKPVQFDPSVGLIGQRATTNDANLRNFQQHYLKVMSKKEAE
ncbi:Rieske 2Fe-2S domain-containing protein [Bacillus sp. B15-48]|uniref:Rieske 2Fe-2S domain-containing protein n=1 Tax=Bacillus sp. B15-48 TaxID=1548601 RepID=UPI00193EEE25|nr:Rieske 2Fe-2S domain-containing protein [Bacillus sp. B15-48]